MSRTIITKSGSKFFTNINSEQLIGHLCRNAGAKHFSIRYLGEDVSISMAYSMDKKEIADTVYKLKILIDKTEAEYPKYAKYFDKECNHEDLKNFLLETIDDFEKSDGYECAT